MKRLEDIQNALYQAAKTDRKRKFYTLHDKIFRNDVLTEAWRRVKANHGTAGIDRVTLESITDEESFISELQKDLENRSYRVDSVKRVYIPKKDHSLRPLGIPTVRDRVVQHAVKLIIEPIFEADFKSFSYGYRPGRSAKEASREIYKYMNFGISGIIDLDIKGFFDHVDHDIMISKVMDRIADGYVIKLIREWLRAGIVFQWNTSYPMEGTPQGGVISPLLANIYLNTIDSYWSETHYPEYMDAHLIRYADDMLILCRPHDAEHILNNLREQLRKIHLSLNMDKTRITEVHKGFDFLSFYFIRKYDAEKGKDVTSFFPSVSATKHFREKVRIILNRKRAHFISEEQLVKEMNIFTTGWTNYFNHAQSTLAYRRLERFIEWKFSKFLAYRHKYRRPSPQFHPHAEPYSMGLKRLAGRISYLHDAS